MHRRILFLAVVTGVALMSATLAQAETRVHSVTIRTVEEIGQPQLRVCTTTRTQHWSNPGSSDTAIMFCQPVVGLSEARAAAALLEQTVFFAHDSATLSAEAEGAVRTIVAFLAASPTASLTLAGHADATGTEKYNLNLSRQRAEAARAFFLANGVRNAQIKVKWYGESRLLVNTQKREPLNRRVEISLSD
jgi:outer membrane protein OmpA-like peptidoglycan-associated protein